MAEVRFKVLGDLSQLRKDLSDMFKKKYKIEVGGGAKGSSDKESKSEKKSTGLLAGILKSVGILSILAGMKPLVDLVKILVNFSMLGMLYMYKYLKGAWDTLKILYDKFVSWATTLSPILYEIIGNLRDKIVEWFTIAVEWVKSLPERIWGWIQLGFNWLVEKLLGLWETIKTIASNLAGWIWEKLQEGFNWLVEALLGLWEGLKEKFTELKEKFIEKIIELKDKIVEKFVELKDKLVEKFVELKDKIIEKLQGMWDTLKDLPGLIWDKIQGLAAMIASAIKSAISFGGGSKGGRGGDPTMRGGESVNDAIITKTGKVIRTHPDDTIIATKTPGSLGGGGKTFNFYGVTPQQIIDTIKRELATEVNASSRF